MKTKIEIKEEIKKWESTRQACHDEINKIKDKEKDALIYDIWERRLGNAIAALNTLHWVMDYPIRFKPIKLKNDEN